MYRNRIHQLEAQTGDDLDERFKKLNSFIRHYTANKRKRILRKLKNKK